MASESEIYAGWSEKAAQRRKDAANYLRCKPRLKLIRYDGEPIWMATDHDVACVMKQGYGKTPAEAYWDWFADEIPF